MTDIGLELTDKLKVADIRLKLADIIGKVADIYPKLADIIRKVADIALIWALLRWRNCQSNS
ncbi:hypothetical protein [Bacillus benzoevorans]|uniref:hypothetical protein n=1 Tax=Bacillus benzoevorans TaxID=1456 RepID=UPI00366C3A77